MKTIDFLPDIYRQRDALRRARYWWAMVVLIFGGAITTSAMAQAWLRHSLYEQLDALTPQFTTANAQAQELAALQAQINRASQEASLYTFLENPWPRTQLIAAIVSPLPKAVRLTQIHLAEEERARTAIQTGPRNSKLEEEVAAKASGLEKDLTKLQEELQRRRTTIEVDGCTTDVASLHDYVAEVSRSPLFAEANIKSLEAATSNQRGQTKFVLRLVVRPGLCEAGSESTPASPTSPATATTTLNRPPAVGGGA